MIINKIALLLWYITMMSVSLFSIQTRIYTTPIFSVLPYLRLHHIILVSKSNDKNIFNNPVINDVYILDYSPIENENVKIALKLFLGKKTKGFVRVIHMDEFKKRTFFEDWKNKTKFYKYDEGHENKIINKIIQNWDTTFHLYTHNCQHFGKYMIEKLKKNSIE